MKKFLSLFILVITISTNSHSIQNAIFPYTIDEQVQTMKEDEELIQTKSNELNTDSYWSRPLTKLDYYLMQIQLAADKEVKEWETIYQDGSCLLLGYFEKVEYLKKFQKVFGRYEKISVTNKVYFDETRGKIVITFLVNNVGKAKKPMKNICKNLLENYLINGFNLPSQDKTKHSVNRLFLGHLYRGDLKKNYDTPLEKIANNLTYILSITSKVNNSLDKRDSETFNMTCYKQEHRSEINYRKWSFISKD